LLCAASLFPCLLESLHGYEGDPLYRSCTCCLDVEGLLGDDEDDMVAHVFFWNFGKGQCVSDADVDDLYVDNTLCVEGF